MKYHVSASVFGKIALVKVSRVDGMVTLRVIFCTPTMARIWDRHTVSAWVFVSESLTSPFLNAVPVQRVEYLAHILIVELHALHNPTFKVTAAWLSLTHSIQRVPARVSLMFYLLCTATSFQDPCCCFHHTETGSFHCNAFCQIRLRMFWDNCGVQVWC